MIFSHLCNLLGNTTFTNNSSSYLVGFEDFRFNNNATASAERGLVELNFITTPVHRLGRSRKIININYWKTWRTNIDGTRHCIAYEGGNTFAHRYVRLYKAQSDDCEH